LKKEKRKKGHYDDAEKKKPFIDETQTRGLSQKCPRGLFGQAYQLMQIETNR